MHLIAEMAMHIAELGHGTFATDAVPGNVFYGFMPHEPDYCICVYAIDPGTAGSVNGGRVSVIVRGDVGAVDSALAPAQSIVDELHEWTGFLKGDGYRVRIDVENGPNDIGFDDNGRPRYSINLRVYFCTE